MSAYRQPSAQRLLPVVIVAVILIAALGIGFFLGTILAGGNGGVASRSQTPSPTPAGLASGSPSASAAGSASESGLPSGQPASGGPAPSPAVEPPADLIPPGSVVRVLADGLRLRDAPTTEGALVQNLPLDQLLVVGHAPQVSTFGPITADAFAWYPVLRLGDLTELPELPAGPLESESASGWVAGGEPTVPYIQLVEPRCPPRPVDLSTLEAMLPWERLTCFGNETITLEGTFGCVGCAPGRPTGGTFEPEWLASPNNSNYLSAEGDDSSGPFLVRLPPAGPAVPETGARIRVTGHFDDAAASTCTIAPGDGSVSINAASASLYCRAQFVADSIEIIG